MTGDPAACGVAGWLLSPDGRAAVAAASAALAAPGDVATSRLRVASQLRTQWPEAQARAALGQALARRQAAGKHPAADRLWWTAAAAEQATDHRVAAHLAARYPTAAVVADLGCSVGMDTLALAAGGRRVVAVDRDRRRLAFAAANAGETGLSARVHPVRADLTDGLPVRLELAWCDPGRRSETGQRLPPPAWQPPLPQVLGWMAPGARGRLAGLGVKCAPGLDTARVAALRDLRHSVEVVSLDGSVRALVLWLGCLTRAGTAAAAGAPATATVLPSGVQLHRDAGAAASVPTGGAPVFLLDPDGAVVRAGLVRECAAALGATHLDARLAYLWADRPVRSPLVRCHEVLSILSPRPRAVRDALVASGAGSVEIKKRGSAQDVAALRALWAPALTRGGPPRTVVLTRVDGRDVALLCRDAP